MNKQVRYFLMIIALALVSFVVTNVIGTANKKRNSQVDGVKLIVQVSKDQRKPIVRTYKKSVYDGLSTLEVAKIYDEISGKREGDLPCIDLLEDPKVYFSFKKNDQPVQAQDIHLEVLAKNYNSREEEKAKKIKGQLEKLNDKTYTFQSHRFTTQYEKYFMEELVFKLSYRIDGVEYFSTFICHQSNAPDGTDFFKNEDLAQPKEANE